MSEPTGRSANAQKYLDVFEHWDPEGAAMRDPWASLASEERDDVNRELRERMHHRNAKHAQVILRDLPQEWRDVVFANVPSSNAELQALRTVAEAALKLDDDWFVNDDDYSCDLKDAIDAFRKAYRKDVP
jgi:hypothetical protein